MIEVDTTKGGDPSYTIPVGFDPANYSVDCNNDGVLEATNQSTPYTCTYPSHGIYTIAISGNLPHLYNGGVTTDENQKKIIDIKQWGSQVWNSMFLSFIGASNLNISATDQPDLSQVTNMSFMFSSATSFNSPINNWDTSHVTDMSYMFNDASSFNQPLNNWDTSNVTNMSFMFIRASSFNQPLNNWDTSNVTDMQFMFSEASNFNQSLAGFSISNATNITDILYYTGLSNMNYDLTLEGWSGQNVISGLSMSANPAKYCNVEARNILTSAPNDWTISDGGLADSGECSLGVEIEISNNEIISTVTAPYIVGQISVSGDVNSDEIYTYTLFGSGADNSLFTIDENNNLVLNVPTDYPQKTNYEITVRTTNSLGYYHDQTLNLTVVDGNAPNPKPTPIPDSDNGSSDDITTPNTGVNKEILNDNYLVLLIVVIFSAIEAMSIRTVKVVVK